MGGTAGTRRSTTNTIKATSAQPCRVAGEHGISMLPSLATSIA